jgi:hypothetical protein
MKKSDKKLISVNVDRDIFKLLKKKCSTDGINPTEAARIGIYMYLGLYNADPITVAKLMLQVEDLEEEVCELAEAEARKEDELLFEIDEHGNRKPRPVFIMSPQREKVYA